MNLIDDPYHAEGWVFYNTEENQYYHYGRPQIVSHITANLQGFRNMDHLAPIDLETLKGCSDVKPSGSRSKTWMASPDGFDKLVACEWEAPTIIEYLTEEDIQRGFAIDMWRQWLVNPDHFVLCPVKLWYKKIQRYDVDEYGRETPVGPLIGFVEDIEVFHDDRIIWVGAYP